MSTAVTLFGVEGVDGRSNDVIFCSTENPLNLVIYFGGDIQDFTHNMETHRDNKNYIQWSLEQTVLLLQKTFVNSHIMTIRPSKMELKTFSCFMNFVVSGNCGIPNHTPMHQSLRHLELLIAHVGSRVNMPLTEISLILIGFSKGCVVLNQFLHEFNTLKTKTSFISLISDMYWLDGGHNGGKNTWITDKTVLETLSTFGIQIHIRVSPYQIRDERRPWIKKEEKIFYNTLCSFKASVDRVVCFDEVPPSIIQHFNVLNKIICEQ